jgi:hypothetical protein
LASGIEGTKTSKHGYHKATSPSVPFSIQWSSVSSQRRRPVGGVATRRHGRCLLMGAIGDTCVSQKTCLDLRYPPASPRPGAALGLLWLVPTPRFDDNSCFKDPQRFTSPQHQMIRSLHPAHRHRKHSRKTVRIVRRRPKGSVRSVPPGVEVEPDMPGLASVIAVVSRIRTCSTHAPRRRPHWKHFSPTVESCAPAPPFLQ